MKLNYIRLYEKLSDKLFYEDRPVPQIGKTLKMRRKSLNLTLSEASDLIGTSISYISKIENDQMKPNFNKIRKLLDHLHVHEDLINYSSDMADWYDKLLNVLLGLSEINDLKEISTHREDFQAKLIELALAIHNENISECDHTITLLYNSVDQMKTIELGIFMLCIAYYYYQIESYVEASSIIGLLLEKNIPSHKLQIWLLELKFKLLALTDDFILLKENYEYLTNIYQINGIFDKSFQLRQDYLANIKYIAPEKYIENILDFDHTLDMQKHYFVNQILKGQSKDIIESIDDASHYPFELALAYDQEKQPKHATYYLNQIKSLPDSFDLMIYAYLQHKYASRDIYQTIKQTLFAHPKVYHQAILLKLYGTTLQEIYKSAHRYKECSTLNDYIQKRINELKLIKENITKNRL